MTKPDASHTRGRDQHPVLSQLVGHADLPERRLINRQLDDGLLDVLLDAVLDTRLPTANYLQSQLTAALLVQLLETDKLLRE